MSSMPAANSPKKERKFYLPVRSSFLIAIVTAILLLVGFFLWYGNLENQFAADVEQLPDWLATVLLSSRWHPVASWVVAILLTVAFVALLYLLIMIVYLVYKRRHATAKLRCEAITVAVAISLSIAFKAWVLFNATAADLAAQGIMDPGFKDVFSSFFGAVYAALGGLSFEGLPDGAQFVSQIFLICAFYGTSVVAGLVFISAIGSSLAYEFYSFLLLRVLRTKGMDIYIFTALNEETLNLADSISSNPDQEKARNALIIFSGSALEPFDRKDKNCVQVMAHGYIYWSVSANDSNTILEKLWPHSKSGMASQYSSITVFAFDSDNDHIPNEEENMDYVLLDINNRLNHMKARTTKCHRGFRAYRACIRKDIQALEKQLEACTPGDTDFLKIAKKIEARNLELELRQPGNWQYLSRGKEAEAIRKDIEELAGIGGNDPANRPDFIKEKIAALEEKLFIIDEQQESYYRWLKNQRDLSLRVHGLEDAWGDKVTDEKFFALQEFKKKSDLRHGYDLSHIGYYILTKRRIDYQAYQDKINSLEKRFRELYLSSNDEYLIRHHEWKMASCALEEANQSGDQGKIGAAKALKKEKLAREKACWQLAKPFSIHVWNEADSIASEAQTAIYSSPSDGDCPPAPDKDLTWVVSLGFGTNGQSIAKALYSFSSQINDEGKAADFFCDVYDPRGFTQIAGLFQMEMPYSVCVSYTPEAFGYDPQKTYEDASKETLDDICKQYSLAHNNAPTRELRLALAQEMPLPAFCFHNGGFGKVGFAELFREGPALWKEKKDQYGAGETGAGQFYCPDYIVVATGDDYESIRVVNAIAALLSQRKPRNMVTLFVNVWDDKNNNLVEGFNRDFDVANPKKQQDFIYAPNVRIVIIGNNGDVYRYDRIIENYDAINYNRVYELVADGNAQETNQFNDEAHAYYLNPKAVKSVIVPRGASDIARNKADLWESIPAHQKAQALASWRGNTLWKRVSSAASYRFRTAFYQMMKRWDNRENFGIFFAKLARVEHQRWMRFHLADGWLYSPKRDDGLRRHYCLLPAGFIDKGTLAYDLFNVFLGVSLCMDSIDRKEGFSVAMDWTKIHNITEQATMDISVFHPRAYDDGKKDIFVTCFGFGKEGEAVAEAIFVNTYDKVRGKDALEPNRFHCSIYGDEDYAPYRVRHSFAIVTDKLREFESESVISTTTTSYGKLLTNLSDSLKRIGGTKAVRTDMSFPDVQFNASDPGRLGFITEFVDSIAHNRKNLPDYIVLSMKDDEKTFCLFRRLVYLFKKILASDAFPAESCTVYVCLGDGPLHEQAKQIQAEAKLGFLRIHLMDRGVHVAQADEGGFRFFAFTMGGGKLDPAKHPHSLSATAAPQIDALCKAAQSFWAKGPNAITDKSVLEAKGLLSKASSAYSKLNLSEYDAEWNALCEEEKRYYVNAWLFLKALQNEADVLRRGGVNEAELLSRLCSIAHHRDVRYLICDSWVFRDVDDQNRFTSHYSNRLLPFRALKLQQSRSVMLEALLALVL
ncbi:MAG: hypothetical protein K6E59_02665 [Bacilli bacterium]|nr:hypothetical protein [Bacilli bacterium]